MANVEETVANDDADDGDKYRPWSRVSDIDFGSMDSWKWKHGP